MDINLANNVLDNYQTHEVTLEGRSYLVAPVVMLKEGVHSGSAGPIYYPPDVINQNVEAWNNVPVTIPHPENNGELISVNEEGGDRFIAGHIRNSRWEEESLKAEAWLDIDRTNTINQAVIPTIRNHSVLQVSTGLGGSIQEIEGVWNDEEYQAAVQTIDPDHLALLPGATGACSWEDGCGIRNQKKEEKETLTKKVRNFLAKWGLVKNETSHNDTRYLLQRKVDELDNNQYLHYVQDVFDSYFIYRAEPNWDNEAVRNQPSKLYKQEYKPIENGRVEFKGEAVEVFLEKQYKPVVNKKVDRDLQNTNDNKGENKMGCCEKRVKALIENERTKFTEADSEWLNNLDEEAYERVELSALPVPPKTEKKVENKEPSKAKTTEEFIAEAPADIQNVLQESIRLHNARKSELVAGLMANEANAFTEDELKGMGMEQLEKLAKLANVKPEGTKANFAANTGGAGEVVEEAMPAPVLQFD